MGDKEIVLIGESLTEKLENESIIRKFRLKIEISMLIGAALATSVLVGEFFISNPNALKIFESFNKYQILILICGLLIFFEGIYFWSIPNLVKLPLKMFLKVIWPYFFFCCTITSFHQWSLDNTYFCWEIVTLVLFFFFFSLYYEAIKVIKTLYKILNNKIHDGKDRLAIVLTIIATIISAIALLK